MLLVPVGLGETIESSMHYNIFIPICNYWFRKSWNRSFLLWWSPTPVEALWLQYVPLFTLQPKLRGTILHLMLNSCDITINVYALMTSGRQLVLQNYLQVVFPTWEVVMWIFPKGKFIIPIITGISEHALYHWITAQSSLWLLRYKFITSVHWRSHCTVNVLFFVNYRKW